MSYEGYEQGLCKNGHYFQWDCYRSYTPKKCQVCGEKFVWFNSVNLTNGSYEGKKRIDGYVKLRKNPIKKCKCKDCGHEHNIGIQTYQIPTNKGRMSG